MTQQEIDSIIQQAAGWVGYLEKAQPFYTHYESKTTAAGSGNFTRFGRIADLVIGGADRRNKDGHPWCASFLLACCYESRAGRVDTTAPEHSLPVDAEARAWMEREIAFGGSLKYFAGCAAWHGAQRMRGGVSSVPVRGAFVLFMRNAQPYHIGIVESINTDGSFYTIEGNTNLHGPEVNPNGGAVARKRRQNSGVLFLVGHLHGH